MGGPAETPPAAFEGPVQAGGPWAKAPPWPLREGETGFPSGQTNLGPVGQPLGTNRQGVTDSAGTKPGQPPTADGRVIPRLTDEELEIIAGFHSAPPPVPPSPGPLPPSPTIPPNPNVTPSGGQSSTGTTPTGTVSNTATATTATTNDSPFLRNGVCSGLPAFAGPEKYTTYPDGPNSYRLGNSEFKQLNDAENQGVVRGRELDAQYRRDKNRPFNEDSDTPSPTTVDAYFSDDSHFVWIEVASVRVYNEYTRIAGATLSNATSNPAEMTMNVSRTGTNTWTQTGGLTLSLARELSAKVSDIGASMSQSLQTQVSLSRSIQESVTHSRATAFMADPCDVLTLYDGYHVVEFFFDYVYMEDTTFGGVEGFEVKRGTANMTSRLYTGMHGLQASDWNDMQDLASTPKNGVSTSG
jgi:hypothetical protein